MKTVRERFPVIYCILAFCLFMIGEYGLGKIAGLVSFTSDSVCQIAASVGGILMMLLLLDFAGRLKLLREKGAGIGKGLLMGSVVIVISCLITILILVSTKGEYKSPAGIFLFLIHVFVIGMSEELLCRGIMAESLLEHYGADRKGIMKAILISSVIFGLSHITNLFVGTSPVGVLSQSLNAALAGILYATIYFRSGNLWVPIIVHSLWDLATILGSSEGIYVGTESVSQNVSASGFSMEQLAVSLIFVITAVILLHSKKQFEQVRQWFEPYCKKME